MTPFTIAVPFWGDHPAYRQWLRQWCECYRASGTTAPAMIATDTATAPEELPDLPVQAFDLAPWKECNDPEYPFDRKGVIVCSLLTARPREELFIVDADAFLQHDPGRFLEPFAGVDFAMPVDEGAFGAHLAPPFDAAAKRSGGILWFGASTHESRVALVREYKSTYLNIIAHLRARTFREERRLLEQHTWTLIAHRRGAPLLPRELNWPTGLPTTPANPDAAIHHHIGKRKWSGQPAPVPGLHNEKQLRWIAAQAPAN